MVDQFRRILRCGKSAVASIKISRSRGSWSGVVMGCIWHRALRRTRKAPPLAEGEGGAHQDGLSLCGTRQVPTALSANVVKE
jgi:hypothetical protein